MILGFQGLYCTTRACKPAVLAHKRLQNRDVLASTPIAEDHLTRFKVQGFAALQHTLGQWVAYTVGVRVLHALTHPIGTGVNSLAGKGITLQHEAVPSLLETGIRREQMPRKFPEPFLEAVQVVPALDAHLLHHFLVEVVEQLLAGILLLLTDLCFQFMLELVELKLNLFRCTTFLVYRSNALLEIHARFHGAQYLIAGAEYAIEQAEFLIQELIDTHVGGAALVEEVHHHHVELLPVTVAASNALFNTLGIPRQIVVDYQVAELQVDALGGGFGRDQNRRLVTEILHQRGAHVGAGRTADVI